MAQTMSPKRRPPKVEHFRRREDIYFTIRDDAKWSNGDPLTAGI
ncbi:hypothetical protein PO124_20035 [Bacillus licheniformis]|nr:hypothetical protein [Bacillus licheniformis]